MTDRLATLACKIAEKKKREQLRDELAQLFARRCTETEAELDRVFPSESDRARVRETY